MPKKLHKALVKAAKKREIKPDSERFDAYVYGTMAKIEKEKKKKKKGR